MRICLGGTEKGTACHQLVLRSLALPLGQVGAEQFARPLDVLRECVCVARERDRRGSWLTLRRGVAHHAPTQL